MLPAFQGSDAAMRIRTMIVDDEPLAREGIRLRLEKEPDIEIVGEAGDGRSALAAIQKLKPDLVFLDVRMPGLGGLDVIDRLRSDVPAVVFVTAYDKFAVQAFEACAVDYLLKPVSGKRFQQALGRVRLELARDMAMRQAGRRPHHEPGSSEGAAFSPAGGGSAHPVSAGSEILRLVLKDRDRLLILKAEEVEWISSAANYVELHSQGRAFMLRTTMKEIEEALNPTLFARIHRATLVRVECIREIRPLPGGEYAVVLHDKTNLRLSRKYREDLFSRFYPHRRIDEESV
jgi:two-component system, LytTR family, response regulator